MSETKSKTETTTASSSDSSATSYLTRAKSPRRRGGGGSTSTRNTEKQQPPPTSSSDDASKVVVSGDGEATAAAEATTKTDWQKERPTRGPTLAASGSHRSLRNLKLQDRSEQDVAGILNLDQQGEETTSESSMSTQRRVSSPRAAAATTTTTPRRSDTDDNGNNDNSENDSIEVMENFDEIASLLLERGYRGAPEQSHRAFVHQSHSRFVPCMYSELEDPTLTLRYFFDVHEKKLVARFLTNLRTKKRLEKASSSTTTATTTETKKLGFLSLRRGARALKATDAEAEQPRDEVEQDAVKKFKYELAQVAAEVKRIADSIEQTADMLTDVVCRLGRIDHKTLRNNVAIMARYATLHESVYFHPMLRELNLPASKHFETMGASQVLSWVSMFTMTQGWLPDTATLRMANINRSISSWATESLNENGIAGERLMQAALPLSWRLTQDSHEALAQSELKQRELGLLRALPFIVVGILHAMGLQRECDRLIKTIVQKCAP